MKKSNFLLILLLFGSLTLHAQEEWESWRRTEVDNTYIKFRVNSGSLSPDGKPIDFIFLPDRIESGTYEVVLDEITYGLYHITRSDFYVTFKTTPGIMGYGKRGVLQINAWGNGYFYEEP